MLYALVGLLALLCSGSSGTELPFDRTALARPSFEHHVDGDVSDAEIRRRIIEESIASYDGPCACPYQTARNGSRCGRRSAYSRPGGEAPLCYPSDVSDEMVRAYRTEHGL